MFRALSVIYPDYKWLPWKFPTVPRNFWVDIKNQKWFIEWAAQELKIKEMSDWYNVSFKQIIDAGGGILLVKNRSLPHLLFRVYPESYWKFSDFVQNVDIWKDEDLATYFVNWLQNRPESDVYDVNKVIKSSGISRNYPLAVKLRNAFPRMNWAAEHVPKTDREPVRETKPNQEERSKSSQHQSFVRVVENQYPHGFLCEQ
ncbi:hypothetical protein HMI54_010222 [Coelomomyces lativittatus]|nr:hypothetical protein HMI54_010222 [Coelomomyces lativittatus]